ncbi:MAG: hypothetical protein R3B72_40480 [Polyangiaceae bacterium]
MRIPVIIHFEPKQQPLPSATLPCPRCQRPTEHRAVRSYRLVRIYFLPSLSRDTEVHLSCTQCGATTVGSAPPGSPSKPFFHRLGCLVWLGVPALGLAGYLGYEAWDRQQRREQYEAEQAAEVASVEIANKAKAKAEAARATCFAAVNGALPDKKVLDFEPQAPTDAAALKGAAYVSIKRTVGNGVPRPPGSDRIGPHACGLEISKRIRDAANRLTGAEDYDAKAVTEEAEKLLAEAEALGTPKTIVATDYRCTKKDACRAVGVWVDVATKKVLAVAEGRAPMEHLGYDEDANTLAFKLRDAANAW